MKPSIPRSAMTAAAAAALLAAPLAHAQSSVAISGYLDAGVYRGFDKKTHTGTIQRSNIAFSGNEDLGGGLAATFKLSHRFEMGTGQAEDAGRKPFWHGESTVGLKGAFGQLRLGRALDVVSANDWAFDPWDNFNRIASPAWQFWHYNYASDRIGNNGTAEYGRLGNGVFYDSPSVGGFSAHLSGSIDRSGVAGSDGRNAGASLNYDQGPVTAMLAHSKNSSGDRVTFLAGKVRFGALALMAAYDRSEFNAAIQSTARTATVGASYLVGATTLKAGYGRLDLNGATSSFIGLGADHALSKRTGVYLSLGHLRPHAAGSTTAYGAGIYHAF